MRTIYEFNIFKKEFVDEIDITKDVNGNEIKTTKKIEENISHKYIIKKPTRIQNDDCELFRAATESDYIRRGIMTAALLEKKILDDGDIYSTQQKKRFEDLNKSFISKKNEYDDLIKIKDADRTEENKKDIESKIKELADIIDEIQDLRNVSANLYNRTAEVMARNKSALWLTLNLSFEDKNGKLVPVFGEGDFDKKLAVYDQIEEREDDYEYSLIEKLLMVVNLWYSGRASTKEEFDAILAMNEQSKNKV